MSPDEIGGVSRETLERLKIYTELLTKWNQKINLVSKTTIDQVWTRHIADSRQIFELVRHPVDHWADLGSGGGFPGLVVAILAHEAKTPARVTLIESDARKCAFLRTVARECGISITVLNDRIEKIKPLSVDVISARALADLEKLLHYANRHLAPNGTAVFHKGKTWGKELKSAQSKWKFSYQIATSVVEAGSVILSIEGVSSA